MKVGSHSKIFQEVQDEIKLRNAYIYRKLIFVT